MEIADRHRDEVGRHLRRPREGDGVLHDRRTRHVGDDLSVRDRRIVAIDGERDVEGRLDGRLIEARKRAPRVGRLELRDRVVARRALAQIEAPQLVIEDSGVADVDLRRSFLDGLRHRQRRRFILRIERHRRFLRPRAGAHGHVVELDVERVQHDGSRGLG